MCIRDRYKITELSEEMMQPVVSEYRQGTITTFEFNEERPEMSVIGISRPDKDGPIEHQLCDLIDIQVSSLDQDIPLQPAKEAAKTKEQEAKKVKPAIIIRRLTKRSTKRQFSRQS
eukprot:TRINITY_DN9245_c0_g2_i3.p1 TRINITY_DN9245_c0_g2~~TRINITY_DN9245_c0_g2_i3.p1  ORF type:complete len:116 (+),score=12.01 TRINITY_DN9245_c0_g2_i3:73-420(+)